LQSIQNQIRILFADITDAKAVRDALFQVKPETVFHLASTPFNPGTFSAEVHFQVNVLGTLHVLEAMKELKDSRLVFTSSAAEYGSGEHLHEDGVVRPGTIFGASKAAATALIQTYVRLHRLNAVILRLFTPYGPWDLHRRLIPHAILSALQGLDVPISEGNQERDFIYIDDVVHALILAVERPIEPGSVFNIGSGRGIPVREAVELTLKLMGRPVKALFGALPTRSDEIMKMSADITLARDRLGWKPEVSLEEGLRRTIAWFTEHHSPASQLV
jgi:nucleoside-diphosphate-sugar epimerase